MGRLPRRKERYIEYKFYITFSILIGFFALSFIKYDIFDSFGELTYRAIFVYNALRICLFGFFLYFLFSSKYFPKIKKHNTGPVVDLYMSIAGRFDPLLGLRSIAFLMVFFGHWFIVVFPPSDAPESVLFRSVLSSSPWGGVWVFFTLSGYLMGKGWVTEKYLPNFSGITTFYRNRALKILPLYLLSIFLVILLKKPELLQLSSAGQLNGLLSDLLFDSNGSGAIGALWSVSTEVQFYLAIPFFHMILYPYITNIFRAIMILVIMCTLFGIAKFYSYYYWPQFWHRHVFMPILPNLDVFLAGYISAIIVQFCKEKSNYIKNGMKWGVLLGVIYYVVLSYISYMAMLQNFAFLQCLYLGFFPSITALMISLIIIFFEISVRQVPSNAYIVRKFWIAQSFLGGLTYSCYVWHEPIILNLRTNFKSTLTFIDSMVYLPIGFCLVLGVAYVFHKYIETHFKSSQQSYIKPSLIAEVV